MVWKKQGLQGTKYMDGFIFIAITLCSLFLLQSDELKHKKLSIMSSKEHKVLWLKLIFHG